MEDRIPVAFIPEELEWEQQLIQAKLKLDMQKQAAQAQREGFRKGIQETLQQAIRTGRQNDVKQLVRELERHGISAEEIAGDTGLTLEEVGKLLPPKTTFTQEEWQEREEKHQLELMDQVFLAKREGLRTGVKKIARHLKAISVPMGLIVQGTLLSEEEINELH
jgi:hypothetical protein